MAKGLFTASACVLLSDGVGLAEISAALDEFEISSSHEEGEDWRTLGPYHLLAFRPEINGAVIVDVVDRPWPDSMGNPEEDVQLFSAWSFGQFGPLTFPHGLERAGQQSWGWPGGREVIPQHKAFLRVRVSYVFGSDSQTPVFPDNYDPFAELLFVTGIVGALLELPQSLCYFNPNGEVLRDRNGLYQSLEQSQTRQVLPLDLWSNIRMFRVAEAEDWLLMDTVGNSQFEQPDFEVWFLDKDYDCSSMDPFMRNLTWHLVQQRSTIADGDTVSGPGDVSWRAHHFEESRILPPRRVIALTPEDGSTPPDGFRLRGDQTPGQ